MSNVWEETYFGDTSRDGTLDYDEDGLTDLDEFLNKVYPNNKDSDNDSYSDGDEVNVFNTDPADPYSHPGIVMPWLPILLLGS
jgi:hypothetical protein